jgi:DNA modification methylase
MTATIHLGDCRQIIATLDDNSIHSIVTDPPYELGFMGKKWDNSGIAYDVQLWTECLRVLKPGGHLLAFGGTRTYHRMTCAIEDSGFEIRDSIHWLYGSGFPKSHDVSKGIDKQRHDRADVLKVTNWIADNVKRSRRTHAEILRAFGFNDGSGMVGHWTARTVGSQPGVPTLDQVPTLLDVLGVTADDVPEDIRRLLFDLNGRKGQPGENWARREVLGTATKGSSPLPNNHNGHWQDGQKDGTFDITAPATDAAKQWQGWGTALKPAHEPIVVARKPLSGTVAANVQQHGTGALNIDGCRVGFASDDDRATAQSLAELRARGRRLGVLGEPGQGNSLNAAVAGDTRDGTEVVGTHARGRWPANVITDGSIDAEWVRYFYSAKASKAERNAGLDGLEPQIGAGKGNGLGRTCATCGSSVIGGCNCPDRTFVNPAAKNHHPTVKPLALMRYLVRLVTPPGGTVLEPFAGSGTTLMAAILEGFDVIGCELTDDYLPIIEGRIAWAEEQMKPDPESLFNQ